MVVQLISVGNITDKKHWTKNQKQYQLNLNTSWQLDWHPTGRFQGLTCNVGNNESYNILLKQPAYSLSHETCIWFIFFSSLVISTVLCRFMLSDYSLFVTCLLPSSYQNQCWLAVNWTPRDKFHSNFIRNTKVTCLKNAFENVLKCQPYCAGVEINNWWAYCHHLSGQMLRFPAWLLLTGLSTHVT